MAEKLGHVENQHPAPPSDTFEYHCPASTIHTSDDNQKELTTQTVSTVPNPSQHADITNKSREILCNLAGLEPVDIKPDSDLIELGVDSLMAMELAHEVKIALKCSLSTEQLMQLTDFQSLVVRISSTLGVADSHHETADSLSQTSVSGQDGDTEVGSSGASNQSSGLQSDTYEDSVDVRGDLHENTAFSNDHKTKNTTPPAEKVIKTFEAFKWRTDEYITTGGLAGYCNKVIPRSTELCVKYIVQALEALGCFVQSATPGQQLHRITHLPKHKKFVDLLYGLLENEARLITVGGDCIVRTDVSLSTKSVDVLLAELLQDEPLHAAEHKLIALLGPNLADCLCGKQEGVQVLFSQGRDVLSKMYAESPFTGIWISLLEQLLKQLLSTLNFGDQPLCILEIGAGTGGTTSKLAAMLAGLRGVSVKYTFTDVSGSLVAAARKRFKAYPFMDFRVLDVEAEPDDYLISSQHIVLSTNCIHATRDLSISCANIRKMLRDDGFLALVEMTRPLPWVDFVFGVLDGWWLFQDERDYVLASEQHWERVLQSSGFGDVDWTDGELSEADMQRLIIAHASRPRYPRAPKPEIGVSLSSESLERQAVLDAYIDKYTEGWSVKLKPGPASLEQTSSEKCVLVTGATGSLGSHIAVALAQRPDINQVICLNRISTLPATTRQHQSLQTRGLNLSPSEFEKLEVIATDTSKPRLGLSSEVYDSLVRRVTHIIHSAWPMSLTRPLRGYETQFKVFRNLLDLAAEAADYRPWSVKIGFQFISSIAVVAMYPDHFGQGLKVPERPTVIDTVPRGGYAEAKFTCENMLQQTLYAHKDRFSASAVRIAQICGSATSGYWNATEYIPILCKSSQVLGVLPSLSGTFSWCPVDLVAASLTELLFSSSTTEQFIYHIDNPSRQAWKPLIALLAQLLKIPPLNIIPHEEWTKTVRRSRAAVGENPALQLIAFFETHFVPMSCGGLVLDVTKASEQSETLRDMKVIGDELVIKYVESWKQAGLLS